MAFFPAVEPQKNGIGSFKLLVNNGMYPTSLPELIRESVETIHFNLSKRIDNINFYKFSNNLKYIEKMPPGNINTFSYMFYNCRNFNGLCDFQYSNIFTNINSLQGTFSNCYNLTRFPINMIRSDMNFDLLNETFTWCFNLVNIPSEIKSIMNSGRYLNMVRTFNGCRNLNLTGNYDIYASNADRTFYGMTGNINANINLYIGNHTSNDILSEFIYFSHFNTDIRLNLNIYSDNNVNVSYTGYPYPIIQASSKIISQDGTDTWNDNHYKYFSINMFTNLNYANSARIIYLNSNNAYASVNYIGNVYNYAFNSGGNWSFTFNTFKYNGKYWFANNIIGSGVNFYRACAYQPSTTDESSRQKTAVQIATSKTSNYSYFQSGDWICDIPNNVINVVEMYRNAACIPAPGTQGQIHMNTIIYLPPSVGSAANMFYDCIMPTDYIKIYCGSPAFFSYSTMYNFFGNMHMYDYFKNFPMHRELYIEMYAYCNGYVAVRNIANAMRYAFNASDPNNYQVSPMFGSFSGPGSSSINYENNCFWSYNTTQYPESGTVYYNYNFKYGTGAQYSGGNIQLRIYYNNSASIVNNYPLYHY